MRVGPSGISAIQFWSCEFSPDESTFAPAANITSTFRFSLSLRDLKSAWVFGCCDIMSKTDFMADGWALAPSREDYALSSAFRIEGSFSRMKEFMKTSRIKASNFCRNLIIHQHNIILKSYRAYRNELRSDIPCYTDILRKMSKCHRKTDPKPTRKTMRGFENGGFSFLSYGGY